MSKEGDSVCPARTAPHELSRVHTAKATVLHTITNYDRISLLFITHINTDAVQATFARIELTHRINKRERKMVTVINAAIYSINKATEMAYQIDYSDGVSVRAVTSCKNIIRQEWKNPAGNWVISGKPYVVAHNKKRQAERLQATAIDFLK